MTIHARIQQNASAVIALHSSASSRSQWTELGFQLDPRRDFVAPNMPGYGLDSVAANHNLPGLASIAGPIIEQMEARDLPVHLVGHSQGGGVAIKIALMRPDLVRSLTLFEPASFHFLRNGNEQDRTAFSQINQISGVLTAAAASGRPDIGMMQFVDFWNGPGVFARLSSQLQKKFADQATVVMADFARGFSESWSLNDLNRLQTPTLMITGLRSPVVAQRAALKIAGAIPNSRTVTLANQGHMAPAFQPKRVNSLIVEHIKNTEAQDVAVYLASRSAA